MKNVILKNVIYGTAAALIAGVLLAAAGCASGPSAKSGRPDWVLNPPKDEEFIYGLGAATSRDESRGWKISANRARADVSYGITAILEGMQIDYQRQAGNDDAEIGENFFQDVNRQLTASVLSGAQVVQRAVGGDGTYYTLVSYSISAAKNVVTNLTEAAAKKAEINANNALKAMDAAFATKRAPSLVESGGEE